MHLPLAANGPHDVPLKRPRSESFGSGVRVLGTKANGSVRNVALLQDFRQMPSMVITERGGNPLALPDGPDASGMPTGQKRQVRQLLKPGLPILVAAPAPHAVAAQTA